jgi:hypothetical protein
MIKWTLYPMVLRAVRCGHVIGRGPLVYSMSNPDRLMPDGTIVEGKRFEVFGSIRCSRLRWHRGEHRS